MVLDSLTGREAQRSVGHLVADPVECRPLPGCDDSTGDGHPDHAGIRKLRPFGGEGLAAVSIVLLVETVEFDEVGAVGRERGGGVVQLGDERSAEMVADCFGRFDRRANPRTRGRERRSLSGRGIRGRRR